MQPIPKIEGYDVRKRMSKIASFFPAIIFSSQWMQIAYCTAASNKLRENKSNFFPALYPSIKINLVNETHIEIQSQWQL